MKLRYLAISSSATYIHRSVGLGRNQLRELKLDKKKMHCTETCEAWWLSGKFCALRPEGRSFD